MSVDILRQHWALVAALLLAAIVTVTLIYQLYRRSGRGQLRAANAGLRGKRRELQQAEKRLATVAAKLQKLGKNVAAVPPRRVQDAKDAMQDAKALHKISHDQVLIARNQVRKIIHEEFPPRVHDKMRARYLPDEEADTHPFSF